MRDVPGDLSGAVDHGHRRPGAEQIGARKPDRSQHAALGGGAGFDARRGSDCDENGAGSAGALVRDGPRVDARRATLLVGDVGLVVDDDQAEVHDRRVHGRTPADGDPLGARPEREPIPISLARAAIASEPSDGVPHGRQSVDGLAGDTDLGNEDEHPASPGRHRRHERGDLLRFVRAGPPRESRVPATFDRAGEGVAAAVPLEPRQGAGTNPRRDRRLDGFLLYDAIGHRRRQRLAEGGQVVRRHPPAQLDGSAGRGRGRARRRR